MNGSPETTAEDMLEGFCENIEPFPLVTRTPFSVHARDCTFHDYKLKLTLRSADGMVAGERKSPLCLVSEKNFSVYVSKSMKEPPGVG